MAGSNANSRWIDVEDNKLVEIRVELGNMPKNWRHIDFWEEVSRRIKAYNFDRSPGTCRRRFEDILYRNRIGSPYEGILRNVAPPPHLEYVGYVGGSSSQRQPTVIEDDSSDSDESLDIELT